VSYKVRNSIALGVLLLIILAPARSTVHTTCRRRQDIETESTKLDEELQNTPNLIAIYNEQSANLADERKRWEGRTKDIPPSMCLLRPMTT